MSARTKVFFLGPYLSWLNCQDIIKAHQKRIQRNKDNDTDYAAELNFIESSYKITENEIIESWIKILNSWCKQYDYFLKF